MVALDFICNDDTTIDAEFSCAEVAQEIYRTSPSFVQDLMVEPSCIGMGEISVIDFNCTIDESDPTGVPQLVPGEECCTSIQGWIASSSESSGNKRSSWTPIENMCRLEEKVMTSTSQTCPDVAASIHESLSNFLVDLPPPNCLLTVHVVQTEMDDSLAIFPSDTSNHKCLQGIVRRELAPFEVDGMKMKIGNCSEAGFGLPSPESQPVNMMGSDFFFYTNEIVAYSLEAVSLYCAEARLLESIKVDELPTDMGMGTCRGQGFERPSGTQSSPFGELLLFGPGIDAPTLRTVHIIDYPEAGKCGEKRVLLTDVEQLVTQEGYMHHACARSNYFIRAGEDNEFTLRSMPPSNPRVLKYNWDFRTWTIDYYRGTVDAMRQTPLLIPPSQRKNALLYGGSYPGPLIEAIEDDLIQVRLANEAIFGETSTIHWHGLHMRGTPFADGAQLISQLPLPPHQSMLYNFTADPPGTFFYHSHIAHQRALGSQGPMIIHSRNDPHRLLYDEDRIIFIAEEAREPRMMCEGFADDFGDGVGAGTKTYSACGMFALKHSFNGEVGNGTSSYPYHLIHVEEGKCYRMRFILAAAESVYLKVELAGHIMTIIALDGTSIVPKEVESFHLHQGSRVDAIVCANAAPGMYGMTATDTLACGWKDIGLADTCSHHAFLSYETFHGPPPDSPPSPQGPIPGVGGGRLATTKSNGINLDLEHQASYRSITPLEDSAVDETIEPYRVQLEFGLLGDEYSGAAHPLNTAYRWFLSENKRSWHYPSNGGIPLLQDPSCYDPEETPIIEIPEDVDEVEVVVNNLTPITHSLHIHGMRAKVINVGHYSWADPLDQFRLPYNDSETQNLCVSDGGIMGISDPRFAHTSNGQVYWGCKYNEDTHGTSNNYENPLEKDLINLPRRGWVVLRFKADNPGIWPFHCHATDHSMAGAMTAFTVLPSQIPEAPEDYAPKQTCLLNDDAEDEGENKAEAGGPGTAPSMFMMLSTAIVALIVFGIL